VSAKHSKKAEAKRSLLTIPTQVDERAEAKQREIDHIEADLGRVERELLAQAELEQTMPVGHIEGDEIDSIISSLLGSGTSRRAAADEDEAAAPAATPATPVAPATPPAAATAPAATPPAATKTAKTAKAAKPTKPAKAVRPAKPAAESAVEPLAVAPAAPVPVSLSDSDVAPAAALAITAPAAPLVVPAPTSAQEPTQEGEAALVAASSPPFTAELEEASASPVEYSAPFVIEPVRRRHVWPLVICAAVVFILVTGGVTLFTKNFVVNQLEKRTAIQQEANGYLDSSIALIQDADSVIVELDRAVENQISEEDLPRLEALIDQIDSTQSTLDTAIEQANLAQETFLGTEEKELAGHARQAAEYRKKMLEISTLLVGYDVAAMKAALDLEYAWTLIVDADANMRSAVEVTAWGAVTDSRDYNQEAVNKLTLAQEALGLAGEVFPQADLAVLTTYLGAKKASAELALTSDQAWLDGDYTTAYSKNEEFITKDAEAVELAGAIPSDPLSLVVTAYEELSKQQREDYKAMRSQAAEADAFLRAYLGVDIRQDDSNSNGE
jgi:hypothetical protein